MSTSRPLSAGHEKYLHALMQDAFIPGISFASITDNIISSTGLGCADTESSRAVTSDTQFWACSLSKPVFAYLVLKLTKSGVLPPTFLTDELPWDEKRLGPQNKKKPLTAQMILSHQSGLPNEGPPEFKFNPGEGFRYSGDGYVYLQKIIEDITEKSLEKLAHDTLFRPLEMHHSTFLTPRNDLSLAIAHDDSMAPNPIPKPPLEHSNAAGSLHTTAEDYARFLLTCMNDPDFIALISPQIHSMEKDTDAKEKHLSLETLAPIDWGTGFGLQKDENGNVVKAFHWGHGPGARNFFAINLKPPQSAVVFLTNSDNGLAITSEISELIVGDISPIMAYLGGKYGYTDTYSPEWQQYHALLISARTAEKKGEFLRAAQYYKVAKKICPENAPELQYRARHAEIRHIQTREEEKYDASDLIKWTGQYGPLKITAGSSGLKINDGSPDGPRDLQRINDGTFMDGRIILEFKLDEKRRTISLNCSFPNGFGPSFTASVSSTAKISKKLAIGPETGRPVRAVDDSIIGRVTKEKSLRDSDSSSSKSKHGFDDSSVGYRRPSR